MDYLDSLLREAQPECGSISAEGRLVGSGLTLGWGDQ
jgi:hypothetical protein